MCLPGITSDWSTTVKFNLIKKTKDRGLLNATFLGFSCVSVQSAVMLSPSIKTFFITWNEIKFPAVCL